MRKTTIQIKKNINIENYAPLTAFIKRKIKNYRPTNFKTLTPEQIKNLIANACDKKYLAKIINFFSNSQLIKLKKYTLKYKNNTFFKLC